MKSKLILILSLFLANFLSNSNENIAEENLELEEQVGSPLMRKFYWNDGAPFCSGMYGDCLPTIVVIPVDIE
ncbi:hypothetical protein [Peijinzhouia sedimentorum]